MKLLKYSHPYYLSLWEEKKKNKQQKKKAQQSCLHLALSQERTTKFWLLRLSIALNYSVRKMEPNQPFVCLEKPHLHPSMESLLRTVLRRCWRYELRIYKMGKDQDIVKKWRTELQADSEAGNGSRDRETVFGEGLVAPGACGLVWGVWGEKQYLMTHCIKWLMMRASVMPFHLHYLYKILLMSISVHLSRKRACFMKQHRMKARLLSESWGEGYTNKPCHYRPLPFSP